MNLDIREIEGVTKCDVTKPSQMRKYRGCDEICAFDILEHFPREKAREVLKMWVDLLKPGGVFRVRCPDFRHAVSLNKPDEWTEKLLYGGQDYKENQHLCGFTTAMMTKLLTDLGLEIVRKEVSSAGNLEIWARK